jgi:hypothetical protein
MSTSDHPHFVGYIATSTDFSYYELIAKAKGMSLQAYVKKTMLDAAAVYIKAHREELTEIKRAEVKELHKALDKELDELLGRSTDDKPEEKPSDDNPDPTDQPS